jgi:hypothetical protein
MEDIASDWHVVITMGAPEECIHYEREFLFFNVKLLKLMTKFILVLYAASKSI